MGAVRDPGIRAKIAVSSNDSDIDPVGACVGMRGSRVQNVVQELKGEKIDIIPYHIDPPKYVCNALAPAEVSRVIIDEENQAMEVIVPDDALSIAIGKRGQNVRLAAKLAGWRLDVKSESSYNADMKKGYDSLVAMPDISLGLVDALFENGFYSVEELSRASVNDLVQIREIDEEMAETLIQNATIAWEEMVAAAEAAIEEEEESEATSAGDDESPDSAAAAANSILEPESSGRTEAADALDIDEEMEPTTNTTVSGETTTLPSESKSTTGAKDKPDNEPIPENNDTN